MMAKKMVDNPSLILASKSMARISMLCNAGLGFETLPANIDEEAFKDNGTPQTIAQKLAEEKALHISRGNLDAYVIGADQILSIGGQVLSKAKDKDAARTKLKTLCGKIHTLTSGVSIVRGGKILWSYHDSVHLKMHDFDDVFLEEYMKEAGDILTQCVGAYAIEETGIRLFEHIDGDYFTILGMPLLPLLSKLRTYGYGI